MPATDQAQMSGDRAARMRILGDAPQRSYAAKLSAFAEFAEPELRRIAGDLDLANVNQLLDLGCGTGEMAKILGERLSADAFVVGLDLSLPHLQSARGAFPALLQGDAERLCFANGVFDFVWSCNTINHLNDSLSALHSLQACIRPGGSVAIAQSGFLPEMFFPWDAHLDDAVRQACHRYYRERYGLDPEDTAGLRGVVGLMQAAGLNAITVQTYVIERIQPLAAAAREYFQSVVFSGTWSDSIAPYLDAASREKLRSNCDPNSPAYCLDRADFHHLQTITVCQGKVRG